MCQECVAGGVARGQTWSGGGVAEGVAGGDGGVSLA